MTKKPKSTSFDLLPPSQRVPLPVELAKEFGLMPDADKGEPIVTTFNLDLPPSSSTGDFGQDFSDLWKPQVPEGVGNVPMTELEKHLHPPVAPDFLPIGAVAPQALQDAVARESAFDLFVREPERNPEQIRNGISTFVFAAMLAVGVAVLAIGPEYQDKAKRDAQCKSTLLRHLRSYPWKGNREAQELQNPGTSPCPAVQKLSKMFNSMCKDALDPPAGRSFDRLDRKNHYFDKRGREIYYTDAQLRKAYYCSDYRRELGGRGKKKR